MKAKVTIAIVLAAVVGLAVVRLRFIRDEGGGGSVLWRSDEAYLFLYDRPIGYRFSILSYLMEPIWEYFYAPAPPEDDAWNLSIIRITPAGAERHDQESSVPIRDFTPIDGGIYAHCPGGVCKWTGTGFQLLSDQEEQEMGGEGRLSKGEFAEANGWGARGIKEGSVGDKPDPYEFSIDLYDHVQVVVRGDNPVTVDVRRPGHASERTWYHEQRTRRVTKAEYEQIFRQH